MVRDLQLYYLYHLYRIYSYQRVFFNFVRRYINKIYMFKKVLLLGLCFLFLTQFLSAQTSKVTTGILYYKQEEFEKAATALKEAVASSETNDDQLGKAYYYLGLCYIEIFNRKELHAKHPEALDGAYNSFVKAREKDVTKKYLHDDEYYAQMTGFWGSYINQANKYFIDSANCTAAMEQYKKAIGVKPDSSKTYYYYSLAALQCKKTDEERWALETCIAKGFKDLGAYNQLLQIYIHTDSAFTKAMDLIAAAQKNILPSAIKDIERLKTERSKLSVPKTKQDSFLLRRLDNEIKNLGEQRKGLLIHELNIYLIQGKKEEGISKFEEGVQLDPENAELRFAYGTVLDKMGEKEKAAGQYKKAIEIKPEYMDAYFNLGVLYSKMGEAIYKRIAEGDTSIKDNSMEYFDKALPYLLKAYDLGSKDKPTVQVITAVYTYKNELEKSLPYLEGLYAANKKDMYAAQSLIYIYERTGQKDKAEKIKSEISNK